MSSGRPIVYVLSKIPGISSILSKKHSDIPIKVLGSFDVDRSKKDEAGLTIEEVQELKTAEVLLADPFLVSSHQLVQDLPHLKWMHSTWAGVDSLMKSVDFAKPLPQYTLTRFGGAFGTYIAEYVVGYCIAERRNFFGMYEDQKKCLWNPGPYSEYTSLSKMVLGILGMGDIGKDVARYAKGLGMEVWGLVSRKTIPAQHRCEHVDQYRCTEELPELLESCDFICSILPTTPTTINLLSGDVLSHCKGKSPVFINVGRGSVIDEESIIKALREGWLRQAVLDVFSEEPLPKDSPLWTHDKVIITPHVAAVSQAWQTAELFAQNYELYVEKKELPYVVDWQKQY